MKKLLATVVATAMLAGCSTMVGQPTEPLQVKRDEPGVVLCMSERAGGGIRLVGKLNEGIYPITKVTLEYRLAGVSDAVPAIAGESTGGLQLTEPRSAKGSYRKGAKPSGSPRGCRCCDPTPSAARSAAAATEPARNSARHAAHRSLGRRKST